MNTTHPSRVDTWIALILTGSPLVVVTAGILVLKQSIGGGSGLIIAGLLVGGLIFALWTPCAYTLTADSLIIKCGVLEEQVPLRTSEGAEKSFSLWSAPALSLHRVKVTLADGVRVISTRDRDEFIADLQARLRGGKGTLGLPISGLASDRRR